MSKPTILCLVRSGCNARLNSITSVKTEEENPESDKCSKMQIAAQLLRPPLVFLFLNFLDPHLCFADLTTLSSEAVQFRQV